jgi:hypothetical protein
MPEVVEADLRQGCLLEEWLEGTLDDVLGIGWRT